MDRQATWILAALRTIEIHTARLANEQLSGTYKSSFKGQGLAFREVRPSLAAVMRRASVLGLHGTSRSFSIHSK